MSETQACVVVVEDEPQIRRFVCDALGKEGCTSLPAATAPPGRPVPIRPTADRPPRSPVQCSTGH